MAAMLVVLAMMVVAPPGQRQRRRITPVASKLCIAPSAGRCTCTADDFDGSRARSGMAFGAWGSGKTLSCEIRWVPCHAFVAVNASVVGAQGVIAL